MKSIEKAIDEIKKVLLQITVLDALLDTVIIVLICYLLLVFLPIPQWLVVFPGIIYLAYHLHKKITYINLVQVEEKFPALKDMLRTAEDNISVTNEVKEILDKQVLKHIKYVKISHFMDMKKMGTKLGAAFLISMLIIVLGFISVEFIDIELNMQMVAEMPDVVEDIDEMQAALGIKQADEFGTGFQPAEGEPSDKVGAAFSATTDIFGEKTLAELGEETKTITIEPIPTEATVRTQEDEEELPELFPERVTLDETVADSPYIEKEYKTYQEIIKNYFTTLAE